MLAPPSQLRKAAAHLRLPVSGAPAAHHGSPRRAHRWQLHWSGTARELTEVVREALPPLLARHGLPVQRVGPPAALVGCPSQPFSLFALVATELEARTQVHAPRLLRGHGHAQCFPEQARGQRPGSLGFLAGLPQHAPVIRPSRPAKAGGGQRPSQRRQEDMGPHGLATAPWDTPVKRGPPTRPASPPPVPSPSSSAPRPSLISAAIQSTTLRCGLGAQNARRAASPPQPYPAFSPGHTLRLASCGARPVRYPQEPSCNRGSQRGSRRWTRAG